MGYSPQGRKESDTTELLHTHIMYVQGFPGGTVVKNLPANAGNTGELGSIPGSGRYPEEGSGNPVQCSCLENPKDRGTRQATVPGAKKRWTQLSN